MQRLFSSCSRIGNQMPRALGATDGYTFRHQTRANSLAAHAIDDASEPLLASIRERVGFIGAGQMGEALIRGFMKAGLPPSQLVACVRTPARKQLYEGLGLATVGNALEGGAEDMAEAADVIVLAVKPQFMAGVVAALSPHLRKHHVVVSVAAGLKLSYFEDQLPEYARVLRVMPNTPSLVGQGASGLCLGRNATQEDADLVKRLMSATGLAVQIEESQMDALTGVSGSGPAYCFIFMEALADGGVAAGLPRDKALALAAQTMLGAATMVLEASGDGSLTHPGVLKDKVASPGGTTIAAISVLEEKGLRGAVIAAVRAAAERSKEMGK